MRRRTNEEQAANEEEMRGIITRAAARHRAPAHVALTFAWLESRFEPHASGDLRWSELDGGARYRKYVLDNPALAQNPQRTNPKAWHAYGLFQLQAAHFVRGSEAPAILFDPVLNADRGCKYIAQLLRKTGGDVGAARLLYTGAAQFSESRQAPILAALGRALERFPEGAA